MVTKVNILKLQHGNIVLIFALVLLSPLPFVSPFSYNHQPAQAMIFDNPQIPKNFMVIPTASSIKLIDVELIHDVSSGGEVSGNIFNLRIATRVDAIDIKESVFVMAASNSEGFQFLNVTDPNNESIASNSISTFYRVSRNNIIANDFSAGAVDISPVKIGDFTYALLVVNSGTQGGSTGYAIPSGDIIQIRNITDLSPIIGPAYVSEFRPAKNVSFVTTVKIDGSVYALSTSVINHSVHMTNITNVSDPSVLFNVDNNTAGYETLYGALGIATVQINGAYYALVTSFYDSGVTIINITDPTNASRVSSIVDETKLDKSYDITTVKINNSYYALVTSSNTNSLTIINITNPASPNFINTITLSTEYQILEGARGVSAVQINDTYYAMVTANMGVQIINITTPSSPTPVSGIKNDVVEYTALSHSTDIVTIQIGELNYTFVTSFLDNAIQVIKHGFILDPDTYPIVVTSNNTDPWYAKAGDNITVQVKVNNTFTTHNASILNATLQTHVENSSYMLNASVLVPNYAIGEYAAFNITVANGIHTLTITEDDLRYVRNVFVDTVRPGITLIDDANYIVYTNTNPTIPGASATDNDPGYSNGYSVSSSGQLNTSMVGSVVTYTYTANSDTAGNRGESVTRNVTVASGPPIDLVNLSIYSEVNYDGSNVVYVNESKRVSIFENTDSVIIDGAMIWGVGGNNTNNDNNLNFTLRPNQQTIIFYFYMPPNTNGNITFSTSVTSNFGSTLVVTQDNITDGRFVIADTISPVITLIGNSTVTINAGENYTDMGASINDTNLIPNPIISSNASDVNTTIPGTYIIEYSASADLAGNKPSNVTRELTVNANPIEITLLKIASSSNNNFARAGQNVTVVLETDGSDLVNAVGTVLGSAFTNVTAGGSGNFTVTVLSGDTNGNATFSITVENSSLNIILITEENITDGSFVTIDTIKPIIVLTGGAGSVLQDETYQDPGTTISDSNNASYAGSVSNTSLNTAILGPQNITYTGTADAAGNVPDSINRTITVLAKPLGLNSLTIESNNNVNTSFAKDGDVITVTLATNGTIGNVTGVIAGNSATYTATGDSASVMVTVDGTFTDTASVTFSINASNADNLAYKIFTDTNLTGSNIAIDTIPPSITLNGANNTIVIMNQPYEDPNATASDASYATGSVQVSGAGNVDITTNAIYTLTYTAPNDPAGNIGSVITRTVTVQDAPPINVNSLSIASNSGNNYANAGKTVTVTLVTDGSDLGNITGTLLGRALINDTNGGSSVFTATVVSGDNGNATFSITMTNSSGNRISVTNANITDSSSVTIDTADPQLQNLTISSDNSNSTIATINDALTITITADEALKGANVTVLGTTYTMNINNDTASANVTVNSTNPEGNVTFNITAFDLAGNTLSANHTNLNSSNVTIDRTNPQLMNLTIYSDNHVPSFATLNDNLTITITANEALKAADIAVLGTTYTMNISGTTATATVTVTALSSEGNVTFDITAADLAGNTLSANQINLTSSNVTIDRTAPSGVNLIVHSDNADPTLAKAGDVINITLMAAEPIMNATLQIFDNDNITMTVTNDTASANIPVPQNASNGQIMFNITAEDISGNTFSVTQANITSGEVRVDTIDPKLTNLSISSDNSNSTIATINDTLTITITADEALKGANVTVLGELYTMAISGTTATATVTVTALSSEGNVTFDITAFDLAGNTLSANQINLTSSNVTIDRTNPQLMNLTIYSDNHVPSFATLNDNLTITITANEALKAADIAVLGTTYTMNISGTTATATVTVTALSSEGNVTFDITAADLAGNTLSANQINLTSSNVTIDRTAPSGVNLIVHSDNADPTLAKAGDVINITLMAAEPIMMATLQIFDNDNITMTVTNDTASANIPVPQNASNGQIMFNITAEDISGNTFSVTQANITSGEVRVDTIDPKLTNLSISSDNSNSTIATINDTLTITITADEALKGANVTVLGELYTMAISGTTATATATVTVTALSSEGNVTFDITAFDLAGNTLSANQINLTSSNVTIDRTNPQLMNLTIYSDNHVPSFATLNDNLTITITANEALKAADIAVLGTTYTMNINNDTASANVTVNSTNPEGNVTFNITAFDLAGNILSANHTNLNSSNVTIDRTNPQLMNLTIYSDNPVPSFATLNDNLTITITADEALKGANVTVLGTTYTMNINNDTASANVTVNSTNPEGNVTFNITAFDLAGNTLSANQINLTSSNVTIDRTAPSGVNLIVHSDNADPTLAKAGDVINITLMAAEPIMNAALQIFDNDNITMTVTIDTASANIPVPQNASNGQIVFNITAEDISGNTFSVTQANITSGEVRVDTIDSKLTNLSISSDNSNSTIATINDTLTITITADEALKGANVTVLGTTYTMNINNDTASANVTVNSTNPEGNVTFNITAFDLAGNTLSANQINLTSSNVTIDRTNPQLMNLTIYSDNHVPSFATLNDNLTITITANEALKAADIAVLGTTYTMNISGTTATATVTVTALSSEGNVTFDITAADLAGNTLSANQINLTSSNVTIDRTNPQLMNLTIYSDNHVPSFATLNDNLTITITANEALKAADIAVLGTTYTMNISGTTATATVTVTALSSEGNVTFDITAADLAGNTLSANQINLTSSNITIDRTNPQLMNLTIYSDNHVPSFATLNDNLTITITANEALKAADIAVLGTTYTMNISGTTATATVTVTALSSEGNVTFDITAADLAGNTLSANQINLTSSNVTIDRTAPSGVNLIVHSDNADPTLAKAGDVINITLMAAEPIMNATLQIFDNDNITMTVTNDTASANIPVPQNASNGQIMFNITAEDISGNTFSVTQANITSGEVRVDTIDPKLTNLSISSDNSNSTIATINDTLTITITADEALKGANVTVLGTTYTMNINNDTASANVTVNSTNPEGNVTFNITAFDLAGNTLSANQINLTSSNVTIDRTAPSGVNLIVHSDNADPTLAKAGDVINITLMAAEPIMNAALQIFDNDNITMTVTNDTASANIPVPQNASNGQIVFNITAEDISGNTFSVTQANITSGEVRVDTIDPKLTNLSISSDNSNSTIATINDTLTITITADEALKGANVTVLGTTYTMNINNDTASANVTVNSTNPEGNVTFNITAFDLAGNTLSANQINLTSSNVTIDRTNPQLMNLTIYSDNHVPSFATLNDNLTITITANEALKAADIAVLGTTYTMNISGTTATATVTVTALSSEGNVTFDITAADLAGNTLSANQINLTSSNVTIDRTAPSGVNLIVHSDNADPTLAKAGDVINITLMAAEPIMMATLQIFGNNNTIMSVTPDTASSNIQVPQNASNGQIMFNITAEDSSGNTFSVTQVNITSGEVRVDTIDPKLTNLSISSDNSNSTIATINDTLTITITADEALKGANVTVLGTTYTMNINNDTASANVTVNSTNPEGNVTFNITAFDLAGNTLSANQINLTSSNVTIDRTNPQLMNLTIYSDNHVPSFATLNDNLTITITANEALKAADIAVLGTTYTMNISGTTATATVTVTALSSEGNVTFDITAADLAGNTLSANQINLTSSNVTIDRTAPSGVNLIVHSDNADPTLAKAGDVINITLMAAEPIMMATLQIFGNNNTIMSVTPDTASSNIQVPQNASNGQIMFNITAEDSSGNTFSVTQVNITSGEVRVDTIDPKLTNLSISSDNSNSTIATINDTLTITITADEALKGANVTVLGELYTMAISGTTATATVTVTAQSLQVNVTFDITAADLAGNTLSANQINLTSSNVTIDRTNPQLMNLTIYSDNPVPSFATLNDNLTITITANEALKGANVTVLGTTYTMNINNDTASANVTVNSTNPEGNVTFNITAFDLAGNTLSANQINLTSSNVTIDRTAPSGVNLIVHSDNADPTLAKAGDVINITLMAAEPIMMATLQIFGNNNTIMSVTPDTASSNIQVPQNASNGQIMFNITAEDSSGNTFSVTQVNITSGEVRVDTIDPKLTNLSISSDNSNSTIATINDTLTITITADEALKGANVTVLGELYTMAISGTTATATVTVTAQSLQVNVTFDITAADLAGNTLSANQINLTSSNVTIDRTNPQLMNLTIYSDNPVPSFATLNDNLTITITANEALKAADIAVLGTTYTMNISGTTATATVTVTALSSEGNVTFDITAADLAGNTLSANQINLTSSNVTIDRTAPSGVNLIVHSDNADPTLAKAGDVINITLMAAEPIMMATLQIFGNNNTIMSVTPDTASSNIQVPQNASNGQIMFNITAEDSSGNTFSVTQVNITSGEVRVDTIDPKLTNLSISSDNSNSTIATINDTLTITITADEALKGANVTVLGELYTMAISGTTATATVTVTAQSLQGNVTFDITAADLAGNTLSANQINLTSSNVTIDRTNPQLMNLTIYSDNPVPSFATLNDNLTITITANEALKAADIAVLGELYTMAISGTTATATVTVTALSSEGNVTFDITAADLAGNTLSANQINLTSSNVTIDRTNPQLMNLTISSDNSNSTLATINDILTITITADETLKGANVTVLGETYTMNVSGTTASANVTVNGQDLEGQVNFTITAFDLAGNSLMTNQTQLNSSNVTVLSKSLGQNSLTIASNNSNSSFAKDGDVITVSLVANNTIGYIVGTIAGNSAAYTVTGNNASATVTVDGTFADTASVIFSINASNVDNSTFRIFTNANLTGSNIAIDTTAPSITLNGINNTRVATNSSYTDPGATASDTSYATGSVQVSGAGTVTITTAGNYTLTYTAPNDPASNIGPSITRTVTVQDAPPININTLTLTSSNQNTQYAKAGDTLTLMLVINDTITSNTVQIQNGPPTTNSSSGSTLTATRIIPNSTIESNATFTITVTNINGTTLTVTEDDLTGSNVFVDTIPPNIILIGSANSGIVLDSTYTDQGANARDGDPNYSGNYTAQVNPPLNTSILGAVFVYTYTANADNAGNPGFSVNRTVTVSNTRSSSSESNAAPTLGKTSSGAQLVTNGFEYNGLAINVSRYHTEFPLIGTNVGDMNTIKMKIYDSAGPAGIKRVELALGVPDVGLYHEAEAFVEVWMQKDSIAVKEIVIVDKLNLLEDSAVSSTVSQISCTGDVQQCLLVEMKYSYREPPIYNTVSVKPVDWDNNAHQFYFNDGIHVDGDSINLPKEIDISTSHATGISNTDETLHLVQINRAEHLWVDQYGYQWIIIGNTVRQITIPEYLVPDDNTYGTLHGPDRNHPDFASIIYAEQKRAQETLAGILGHATIIKPLPENGGTIYFDATEPSSRDSDSFKLLLELEAERMYQISNLLYPDDT